MWHKLWKVVVLAFCVAVLSVAFTRVLQFVWPGGEQAPSEQSVLAQSGTAQLTPEEKRTVSIYKKASPAVVNITSTTIAMDHFFNVIPQQGVGSGVILTESGYILTNAHVVLDADRLEVMLENGEAYKAKLVGGDISKDIALIKIDAKTPLPTIELGDSDRLQIGQSVYAIGNPFSLTSTLTTGVISSVGRTLRAENGRLIENVIQTDAAINPGNSGGALLDSDGQLIGINTAIFSPSGAYAGIGFAIPVNTARRIANDLIQHGKVLHPYLGIQIGLEVTPAIARALDLPVEEGLMITQVVPGGPAHKAGIQGADKELVVGNRRILLGGDIVLEYDGHKAESADHFINYVETKRPGETLHLKLVRDGQTIERSIQLAERPETR